ncbi:MAG: dockerin type I domain-containing protein [Cyanobacteriota bacterium]|nr:dockerin type I domain-containing protein [Cyanobacteriota bacterium]
MILVPTVASAQTFLPGDLDGDGRVTTADLTILDDYLRGIRTLSDQQITAADVDRDGRITERDWQQVQQSVQAIAGEPNSQINLNSAYAGQVVDRLTGKPLSNVEVEVPGAGVAVRTDAQGRFQLPESLPDDQILVAKLENYVPYSQTTQQGQSLQLQLDRLDPTTTLLLQTDVVHLGDDAYSPNSAGADQFRLKTQGTELTRSFSLSRLPTQPPSLRIGSLIGLDTPEAARAGQTRLVESDMTPLAVELNGVQVSTIAVSGNDLRIPLPLNHLRVGLNTVILRTGKTYHPSIAQRGQQVPVSIPLLGGNLRIGIPLESRIPRRDLLDYDDIELANIVIDLPTR